MRRDSHLTTCISYPRYSRIPRGYKGPGNGYHHHGARRDSGDGENGVRRRGASASALHGQGHGSGNSCGQTEDGVRSVFASGRIDGQTIRRNRPGVDDLRAAGGNDGRKDLGAERTGKRERVSLCGEFGSADGTDGTKAGGAAGTAEELACADRGR